MGYPILGLAYLVNRLGGIAEAFFFVGFTVIVLAQLSERTIAFTPSTSSRAGTRRRGNRRQFAVSADDRRFRRSHCRL